MMQLTLKSQNIFCDKGITKGKTQIVVTYTHTHRHTQTYCCSVAQSCPPLCYHMDRVQHTRLPCLPLSPRVCSSSCPLSRWCHPTISSTVTPYFSLPSIVPSIRVFSNESVLHIRWAKYWNFSFNISISPFSEYSGLISFRID